MRFLEGLQDGDFAEGVDKNGRPVYYWAEHEHSEMRGKTDNTRLKRGREDLSDADLSIGLKMFSSYSSFNFKHAGGSSSSSRTPALAGSEAALAIADRGIDVTLTKPQWQEAQAMLNQSKSGFDKIIKTIKTALNANSYDANDPLYQMSIFAFMLKNKL